MTEATPAAPAAETPATDDSSSTVVEPVSDAPSGEAPADPPAADPAEPVSDPPADDEPPQGGRKGRAQERIEELAQTNKYLREHNEFLREHIAKMSPTAPAPAAPAEPAAPAAPEPMPTLESFNFDQAAYAKAMDAWIENRVSTGVKAGVAQELSTRESQQTAQTQEQVIVAAAAKFREGHPDFDVVVGNPRLPWTPTVMDALREAGDGSPALGYHLASNPDKLARIAKMPPKQQLMELGRIQATLTAATAPPPPPPPPPKGGTPPAPKPGTPPAAAPKRPATTNAPPPPTPVSGSASPEVDPMKMSGTEWAKWRRQQVAERQKTRPGTVLRP